MKEVEELKEKLTKKRTDTYVAEVRKAIIMENGVAAEGQPQRERQRQNRGEGRWRGIEEERGRAERGGVESDQLDEAGGGCFWGRAVSNDFCSLTARSYSGGRIPLCVTSKAACNRSSGTTRDKDAYVSFKLNYRIPHPLTCVFHLPQLASKT